MCRELNEKLPDPFLWFPTSPIKASVHLRYKFVSVLISNCRHRRKRGCPSLKSGITALDKKKFLVAREKPLCMGLADWVRKNLKHFSMETHVSKSHLARN